MNYHSQYTTVLFKYKKFKYRLDKAIRNGSFARYTYKKRQMLLKRLERLKRQLEQLSSKWKLAGAGAMAIGAMTISLPEAQAQQALKFDGSEFTVNEYTTSSQRYSDVATDDAGNFVVVWESEGQDLSSYGIYAQLYDNTGSKIGAEFQVNTYTASYQSKPAVAMDSDGDFVVVWHSYGQESGGGEGTGIYAQRFDNTGSMVGVEFLVNTHTTSYQRSPDVAMDSNGDFVVVWDSQGIAGEDGYGIRAQRYSNTGATVGSEFSVNTYTTSTQRDPSVAMDDVGNFIVTWQSNQEETDGNGIYAQLYDDEGTVVGDEIHVNTTETSTQGSPDVAMDDSGDFVITWDSSHAGGESRDVMLQRFDSSGNPVGSEIQVNDYDDSYQEDPAIGIDSDGDFVVVWQSRRQDGDQDGVFAKRYSNDGNISTVEFQVNTHTTSDQNSASVAVDADGDMMVAWTNYNGVGGQDIDAQRLDASAPVAPTDISLSSNMIADNSLPGTKIGELSATDADIDAITFSLVSGEGDDDNANFNISGNDLLAASFIDFEIQSSHSVRIRATDFYGLTYEESFTITVDDITEVVGPVGFIPDQVNTFEEDTQNAPSVAMDSDGNYVVVWHSWSQVSSWGVFGQRYDNQGNEVGAEFQVNSFTTYQQRNPSVAMNDDGDFVVVWDSNIQDGSNYGVYAQLYDNTANVVKSEFPVNSETSSNQRFADVAMDDAGNFVVVWTSSFQDNSSNGIYGQRFDNSGSKSGSEFIVNSHTTNDQQYPAIAIESNGDFVVVWESNGQDNSLQGVYGKRFTAIGGEIGSEFSVNTFTTGNQRTADIAMDDDGDFVVVWQSYQQDGDADGVYAQRYDKDGLTVDSEFRVNTESTNAQNNPRVAMNDDGDFVVSWDDRYYGGRGGESLFQVYVQRYNSAGVAIGTNFSVGPEELQYLTKSSIAMDNDGDFTVAMDGRDNDLTDSYEVFAQAYSNNVAPTALSLGSSDIDENSPIGSSIGVFTTDDINDLELRTLNFVGGEGDDDNERFGIEGGELVSNEVFDFEETQSYSIRVRTTDAGGLYIENSYIISINDINEIPVVEVNEGITVDQRDSQDITASDLLASDQDDATSDIVFTVTSLPANGSLFKGGTALAANGTFTQADIDGNLISYSQNGNDATSDSFTFTVSDGELTTEPEEFDITITPDPLGIEDDGIDITMYPTPTSGDLNIRLDNSYLGMVHVEVMDLSGKKLHEFEFSKESSVIDIPMNLSQLNPGVHVIEIRLADRIVSRRIIKN